MEKYEVVVVGGGPAGAICAAAAAEASARVLLLERALGAPVRCAGLISPRTVELLELPPSLVLRGIRGVRIHSPGGRALTLSSPKVKGCVIDRAALNDLLLARAKEAGAIVWAAAALGYRGKTLNTTAGPVGFEVLVGADGPVSGVARWAGLPRPSELLVGVQAQGEVSPWKGDHVEVFLGRGVAPGFFGWAIPAGEGEVRVGLATDQGRRAGELLDRLLAARFPQAVVRERIAGLIPIGPPKQTASERVLLVGDAAGQVKPLSGGGLLFGPLCARIAGEIAAQGPEALPQYEARWRAELGEEITFGLRARRFFLELSDQEFDQALVVLNRGPLRQFLAEQGDIDHPSQLIRAARSRPRLWFHLLPLLNSLGPARVRELLGRAAAP